MPSVHCYMIINEYINVKDDRLIDGLTPVVRIMSQIERSEEPDVTVDFLNTQFISPVFALSLIVYLTRSGKQVSYRNVPDYLERIGLCNGGIKPDEMRQTEFLAALEKYASKTYVANGLKYMIDETLDNITEHSESDRGYIYAQAYPNKGFLDVCIADRGVSLLGSYEKLPDNEIVSDMEAIKAANRGLSSKNLPDAENRGFGIMTSKQMLIQGLGGQYLMISGGSLYIKTRNIDSFYAMPHGLRWNGTIVALRIPYHSTTFYYINYIE